VPPTKIEVAFKIVRLASYRKGAERTVGGATLGLVALPYSPSFASGCVTTCVYRLQGGVVALLDSAR
jgi:hypothetical protein